MTRRVKLTEQEARRLRERPNWKTPPRHRNAQAQRKAAAAASPLEVDECRTFIAWTKLVTFAGEPLFERVVHVPNERGKRSAAIAILVAIGLRPGFLDYVIFAPYNGHHGLMIEAKRIGEEASQNQGEWIERLNRWGYTASCAQGSVQLIEAVRSYMRKCGAHASGVFVDSTRIKTGTGD